MADESFADGLGGVVFDCVISAHRAPDQTRTGRGHPRAWRRHRRDVPRPARFGHPPDHLIVVEIIPEMAAHLRWASPGVMLVAGDACRLEALVAGGLVWPPRQRGVRPPACPAALRRG